MLFCTLRIDLLSLLLSLPYSVFLSLLLTRQTQLSLYLDPGCRTEEKERNDDERDGRRGKAEMREKQSKTKIKNSTNTEFNSWWKIIEIAFVLSPFDEEVQCSLSPLSSQIHFHHHWISIIHFFRMSNLGTCVVPNVTIYEWKKDENKRERRDILEHRYAPEMKRERWWW